MGTEPKELRTLVGDKADKRREWRGTSNSACKGEACFTDRHTGTAGDGTRVQDVRRRRRAARRQPRLR